MTRATAIALSQWAEGKESLRRFLAWAFARPALWILDLAITAFVKGASWSEERRKSKAAWVAYMRRLREHGT